MRQKLTRKVPDPLQRDFRRERQPTPSRCRSRRAECQLPRAIPSPPRALAAATARKRRHKHDEPPEASTESTAGTGSPVSCVINRDVFEARLSTLRLFENNRGPTRAPTVSMGNPAIANPSSIPATVPPVPSGSTTREGIGISPFSICRASSSAAFTWPRMPSGWLPPVGRYWAFLRECVVACGGDRGHRRAMDPRPGEDGRDPAGDCVGDRIHVVLPPERDSSGAESGRVNRSREHVGRAGAADGDYGIALTDLSEEKFEGTNLVSSAEGCVEVVPLDPEVRDRTRSAPRRGRAGGKAPPAEGWQAPESGRKGGIRPHVRGVAPTD